MRPAGIVPTTLTSMSVFKLDNVAFLRLISALSRARSTTSTIVVVRTSAPSSQRRCVSHNLPIVSDVASSSAVIALSKSQLTFLSSILSGTTLER